MSVYLLHSRFLLLSMISHVIPYASDEDEAAGAQNDPEPKNTNQVSYRHLAFIKQEIRRAGEQTSPQVARAAGHPAKRVNAAG